MLAEFRDRIPSLNLEARGFPGVSLEFVGVPTDLESGQAELPLPTSIHNNTLVVSVPPQCRNFFGRLVNTGSDPIVGAVYDRGKQPNGGDWFLASTSPIPTGKSGVFLERSGTENPTKFVLCIEAPSHTQARVAFDLVPEQPAQRTDDEFLETHKGV